MELPKSRIGDNRLRISTSVSIESYYLAKEKGIKWSEALKAGIKLLAKEAKSG